MKRLVYAPALTSSSVLVDKQGMAQPHGTIRKPLRERLYAKLVISDDPDDCWGWFGSRGENRPGKGHARLFGGVTAPGEVLAHRISYILHVGPIPEGLNVLHHCDNPPCCNPRHLYIGTHSDNMRDRVMRGREADRCGQRNPSTSLTDNDVLVIRERYATETITQTQLGYEYGVSQDTISKIVNHKTWSYLS